MSCNLLLVAEVYEVRVDVTGFYHDHVLNSCTCFKYAAIDDSDNDIAFMEYSLIKSLDSYNL